MIEGGKKTVGKGSQRNIRNTEDSADLLQKENNPILISLDYYNS